MPQLWRVYFFVFSHITLAGQGPFPTLPPLLMKERMTHAPIAATFILCFVFVSSTTGVSRPLADFLNSFSSAYTRIRRFTSVPTPASSCAYLGIGNLPRVLKYLAFNWRFGDCFITC